MVAEKGVVVILVILGRIASTVSSPFSKDINQTGSRIHTYV